jgi:membrane protein YdbS with pleckstrin-like domain
MRWEWNLSGPGSFSVSRVLATVYRSGGVYAIIGIIAGFLLPVIIALVIVIGGGTSWVWMPESEGSGWGAVAFLLLGVVFLPIAIPIFVHRRRVRLNEGRVK